MTLGLIWQGDPVAAREGRQPWSKIVYQIVTRIGNARVIYSAVFLLAVFSYMELQEPLTRFVVAFWAIILVVKELDLDGFIRAVERLLAGRSERILGTVTRLLDPNVVRFDVSPEATCSRGTLVALTANDEIHASSPIGLVVGHRLSPEAVEAEILLLDSTRSRATVDRRNRVLKVDLDHHQVVAERLKQRPLELDLDRLVGYAHRDSNIARLFFEVTYRSGIAEGHLVSVPIENSDARLLFQLLDGTLMRETSIAGSERAFTVATAEQLGTWDSGRQGFESHSWVVRENSPVFHVTADTGVERVVKDRVLEVGQIPNCSYPVNISVNDLVLYHSAILGVTGSGKSFLAYHLIEQAARRGIKVLCLDITGDYRRYVRDAVLLEGHGATEAFLSQEENRIGIIECHDDRFHPIRVANKIAKVALDWCRQHRGSEEIRDPTPKVLLVLEEAHTLVPEWNSNPERNLQDIVNQTAQTALQARKYGLGFMVITQRTANVTKSILNQCNTIFAFQAYDETGFDFMRNYMGSHHVSALPNLQKRQGVIVGKASVSDRPVIARFFDQDREASDGDVAVFDVQAPEGLPER